MFNDFTETKAANNPFAFYHAIGIKLTDTPEITKILIDETYSPIYFYRRIKDLEEKQVLITNLNQFIGVIKTDGITTEDDLSININSNKRL